MKQALLAGVLTWWAAWIVIMGIGGMDVTIYRYNAQLTIDGQNAYTRPALSWHYGQDSQHPRYLDYTGAQHALYTLIEQHQAWGLYAWGCVALIALLLYRLHYPALVLLFPAVLLWLAGGFEDKALFVGVPLALWWGVKFRHWRIVGLLAGFALTFHASTLYLLLPLLILAPNKRLIALYIALGAGVGALPYLPDSLLGWQNRLERMSITPPFWWSFWRLIPLPALDKPITLGLGIMAIIAAKRGNLAQAWSASITALLLTGNYTGQGRALAWILVLSALYRDVWLWGSAAIIGLYALSSVGNLEIQVQHLIVFWGCLVLVWAKRGNVL